ncbi:hypothetical protein VFPPC_16064 [Pochonia chlamydosporia 170]|uniref:Uncharacterized protein n=1 Tax=Pochonia chlamydosporia 170 TaxID=1380566 RepID=A0A179FMF0_METCM|nr:hypothetical protein VFPPC_16064 [Pochonia chlamydosporia 170]OAQ66762.1 hypothetical protein VFPPC_16064 [Pochonia chlamydosporia 170]
MFQNRFWPDLNTGSGRVGVMIDITSRTRTWNQSNWMVSSQNLKTREGEMLHSMLSISSGV